MSVMALTLSLLVATPPASDPSALIRELGSPRQARREAARAGLTELGPRAIPFLRQARTARDAEIRHQSSEILDRIEADGLLRPTPVELDFAQVGLDRVLAAVAERTQLRVEVGPAEGAANPALDCRTPGPVPFWQAVDAIAGAAGLRPEPGTDAANPSIRLVGGDLGLDGPVSDSGPFRVQLSAVRTRGDRRLTRSPAPSGGDGTDPAPASTRSLLLEMVVLAEPRLALAAAGPVRNLHAIDDRGRALAAPARTPDHGSVAGPGDLGRASLPIPLEFDQPAGPATRIDEVAGSIPVRVAARRGVPATAEIGRPVPVGRSILTVTAIEPARDGRPARVQVSSRPADVPADRPGPRVEPSPMVVEVVDAQGRALAWFPARSVHDGSASHWTLVLGDAGAVPASVRFHEVHQANAEIPFRFAAIPLP